MNARGGGLAERAHHGADQQRVKTHHHGTSGAIFCAVMGVWAFTIDYLFRVGSFVFVIGGAAG